MNPSAQRDAGPDRSPPVPPRRLLVLAIDGLDWALLQALIDAGRMPCLAQLISSGSSGAMAMPPLSGAASAWTTVATGVLADRHGICHDLVPTSSGLGVTRPKADEVRVPTLWDRLAEARWHPHVAGWPGLRRSGSGAALQSLPHSARVMVDSGFGSAANATPVCWPLPPDIAWPPATRQDLRDTLVHPQEVPKDAVETLLAMLPDAAHQALEPPAREFVALWSSIQALGLAWVARPEARAIGLRFEGLPAWTQQLMPFAGHCLPEALAPTYAWFDMLVGRYMHLLGRAAHIALVTEGRLPRGGYRGSGIGLENFGGGGGLVLAGPGVPPDGLLSGAWAQDVCPTLLRLLGLAPAPGEFDGRDLLDADDHPLRCEPSAVVSLSPQDPYEAPVSSQESDGLAWLVGQVAGSVADLQPLRSSAAHAVQAARLVWAAARRIRGQLDDAIRTLSAVLAADPDCLDARIALGEALVASGRAEDCWPLLAGLPSELHGGVWQHALAGLVAHAARDWPTAEAHWLKLVAEAAAPLNARAWLGWARLLQGDWAGAGQWLRQAVSAPGDVALACEGLGRVCLHQGEMQAAMTYFGRAIAAQPLSAHLHLQHADACLRAGNVERACAGWWRVLALAPEGSTARAAALTALSHAARDGAEAAQQGARRGPSRPNERP